MLEHGIENVRGWMFTTERLDEYQVDQVCDQVCEKFDLCRQCGGKGHFVGSCRVSRYAKWMRDMGVEQQESTTSTKKVFLQCSYAEKEQAKALGACWVHAGMPPCASGLCHQAKTYLHLSNGCRSAP
jgi:hypothetical protein